MDDINLESLKYSELQKLAKQCGIRANMKVEKIVKAIREFYSDENSKVNVKSSTNTSSTSNPSSSEHDSELENTPKIKKTRGRKGRGRKKNSKGEETEDKVKTEDEEKTTQNKQGKKTKKSVERTVSFKSPDRNSLHGTPSLKRTFAKSPAARKAVRLSMPGSPFVTKSPATMKAVRLSTPGSPVVKKSTPTNIITDNKTKSTNSPAQKRKRTISGNNNKTPPSVIENEEPSSKRQRKSSTPTTKTTPQPNTTPKTPKSVTRKSTSPGVQSMIKAMDGLSSQQMKSTLLEALDKKVLENPSSSPVKPSTSGIPRFTAFLAKKNEQKNEQSKLNTPDWKKIHKKQFSKFDNIEAYMEKKRKRAENLTGSIKKAQKLLKETQTAVNLLKSTKTPKITKPITPGSARSSFQSPKVFKPSNISTKTLNLKFGSDKLPQSFSAKVTPKPNTASRKMTPRSSTPSTRAGSKTTPRTSTIKPLPRSVTPKTQTTAKTAATKAGKAATPRQSTVNTLKTTSRQLNKNPSPRSVNSENSLTNTHSSKPGRKSFGDGLTKGFTPFKTQSLNTSINNCSLRKQNFNLKASLSKPLSWKPYTGKLQPLELNKAYKNINIDKNALKTPQTQTIKNRRQDVQNNRAEKKSQAQMNRRGITAS